MIIRVVFYLSAADIRDQVLNEDLYGVYSDQEAREIRAKMPHSIVNMLIRVVFYFSAAGIRDSVY